MPDGDTPFQEAMISEGLIDVSTEPARLGVPVWREHCAENVDSRGNLEAEHDEYHGDDQLTEREIEDFGMVPGLWFATTPEAVVEMRKRASLALTANGDDGFASAHDAADAVLRALGFTDA